MESKNSVGITVAARICGEDIRSGDFIAILSGVVELPSFLWSCSGYSLPTEEPVRMRYIPRMAGLPCKVISVCLPFVYVKCPRGQLVTLDTRQQQLVRLDCRNGRNVWKRMKKEQTSSLLE